MFQQSGMAKARLETKVLIYGLGAIGSFYAFILSRNETVKLTVIARSNYDAVSAKGIRIISDNHGEHIVRPYKVLRNAFEEKAVFDYIVCAHKAINQVNVPSQIASVIDERETTIIIIQNGVGNEDAFRKYFPCTTILSGVTWVGAHQARPGIVTHIKSEDLQIGLFPNEDGRLVIDSERLAQFASLLKGGGTAFKIVPNIQAFRWEKVVWNAAWNSLTTLTLMDTHTWLSSSHDAIHITRRLMTEVIDVARGMGVMIEYNLIEEFLVKIQSLPPMGTSMRTDLEHGKPIEVEMILGYPIQMGRKLGLSIPTIEVIYVILTAINKRLLG